MLGVNEYNSKKSNLLQAPDNRLKYSINFKKSIQFKPNSNVNYCQESKKLKRLILNPI